MNLVSSPNIYRNSAKSRRLRRNCINERDVSYGQIDAEGASLGRQPTAGVQGAKPPEFF